jgi:hypothetical protein
VPELVLVESLPVLLKFEVVTKSTASSRSDHQADSVAVK